MNNLNNLFSIFLLNKLVFIHLFYKSFFMKTTKLNSRVTVPVIVADRHYTARFTYYVENPINTIFRVKLNTGEEFDAVANDYGWGADRGKYKAIAKALAMHLDTLLYCYEYPHYSLTFPYQ